MMNERWYIHRILFTASLILIKKVESWTGVPFWKLLLILLFVGVAIFWALNVFRN